MTVSDGVNMYVYGSPVLIGTSTQDGAKASVKQFLRLSLSDIVKNLGNVNEKFMDGATKRHFSNVSGFWEEVYTNSQLISDDEGPNDILKITEDFVEIDWSEKQIKETYNKKDSFLRHTLNIRNDMGSRSMQI